MTYPRSNKGQEQSFPDYVLYISVTVLPVMLLLLPILVAVDRKKKIVVR